MKIFIIPVLMLSFIAGLGLAGCVPEQEDADATLAIVPEKKLSAVEIAALGDTSTCVFSSSLGRVVVTLDSNLNILPPPRGNYDFVASRMPWDNDAIELLHSSFSGYDDELRLSFFNYSTNSYGIRAGVYGTTSGYGNGRVTITGKYMTNGSSGERSITPIGNPKIYVKKASNGINGYEIIFCEVKMNWQYMYSFSMNKYYYTPVTLNGKVMLYN
ncbi:MAG: hypothetical protein V4590_10880 [Bacteroidota bacterium]